MPKTRIGRTPSFLRYGPYPIGYVQYPARHEHEAPGRGAGTGDPARGGGGVARGRLPGDDHGPGRRPGRDEQERHLPPLAHRAALGIAAYRHLTDAVMPNPDTGTLRG